MSATTLSDYLATKPGLGEHYGTFGDVIRDELGIETLAQAQTRLTESVLVQVRLSSALLLSNSLTLGAAICS